MCVIFPSPQEYLLKGYSISYKTTSSESARTRAAPGWVGGWEWSPFPLAPSGDLLDCFCPGPQEAKNYLAQLL